MKGQTVILAGSDQRQLAKALIDRAPANARVNVREQTRSTEQNDKMWAMLSDISRAKPMGWKKTPDQWKGIIMHTLGHESRFETDLNGEVFPAGLRSSSLTKAQMSDLIEFMYAFGAQNNVAWSEPVPDYMRGAA